jgi:hypothetical protein
MQRSMQPTVPMVVLTGMRHEAAEADKKQMWLAMHRRFVERVPEPGTSSGRTSHGLATTEPKLVIRAVRELLEETRQRT